MYLKISLTFSRGGPFQIWGHEVETQSSNYNTEPRTNIGVQGQKIRQGKAAHVKMQCSHSDSAEFCKQATHAYDDTLGWLSELTFSALKTDQQ